MRIRQPVPVPTYAGFKGNVAMQPVGALGIACTIQFVFCRFVHAFVRLHVAVVPRYAVLVFVAPATRRTHSTFLVRHVAMKAVGAFLMRLTDSARVHLREVCFGGSQYADMGGVNVSIPRQHRRIACSSIEEHAIRRCCRGILTLTPPISAY